jgi:DNA-binding NarL/FixJ family response regulator
MSAVPPTPATPFDGAALREAQVVLAGTVPSIVRVLLCDDRMVVREALKQALSEAADVTVIDEADNGTDCVRLAQRLRPDVVLLDVALIGRDGLETLAELKQLMPQLPVLMLSTYPERQYAAQCMKLGAAGCLHKSVEAQELARALRTAAAGRLHITPAVAAAMSAASM